MQNSSTGIFQQKVVFAIYWHKEMGYFKTETKQILRLTSLHKAFWQI